ncbi:Helicase SRCAP [Carpediemonas membranifera]|uniref:Helicase SRCAP n=1 Tax=Carpediemonas membranifera TaxID=201153 RepID=A0A8J6DYQ4_9EUKA|nr:Helicase SRCAP [Carpediemonas membranifera]|eukprot:KAG9392604.1 Helicase SRCAP [Carpediemonas membranifera]
MDKAPSDLQGVRAELTALRDDHSSYLSLFGQFDEERPLMVSRVPVPVKREEISKIPEGELFSLPLSGVFTSEQKAGFTKHIREDLRKIPCAPPPIILSQDPHSFLLRELEWMATDFIEERRLKAAIRRKLAVDAARELKSRQKAVEQLREKHCREQKALIRAWWKSVHKAVDRRGGLVRELTQRQEEERQAKENMRKILERTKILTKMLHGTLEQEPVRVESLSASDDEEAPQLPVPRPASPVHAVDTVARPWLLESKLELRDYQMVGLTWMSRMFTHRLNGILADEMGLGKTIQTISLLAHLATEHSIWGPHLIVVPTSVLLNWEMELHRWCPKLRAVAYYGSKEHRKNMRSGWDEQVAENSFNVLLTSYEIAVADEYALKRKNWVYLILDEAHRIRNAQSRTWSTLLGFKTKRRLLLTGTPLQNDIRELWALLHFLMPKFFESRSEFMTLFGRDVSAMAEGDRRVNEELITQVHDMLGPFILRRLKHDVETQLPKKREYIVWSKLARRQEMLYEEFVQADSTRHAMASGEYLAVASILMQLRKVCNHPDLFMPRIVCSPYYQPNDTLTQVLSGRLLRWLGDEGLFTHPTTLPLLSGPRYSVGRTNKGPMLVDVTLPSAHEAYYLGKYGMQPRDFVNMRWAPPRCPTTVDDGESLQTMLLDYIPGLTGNGVIGSQAWARYKAFFESKKGALTRHAVLNHVRTALTAFCGSLHAPVTDEAFRLFFDPTICLGSVTTSPTTSLKPQGDPATLVRWLHEEGLTPASTCAYVPKASSAGPMAQVFNPHRLPSNIEVRDYNTLTRRVVSAGQLTRGLSDVSWDYTVRLKVRFPDRELVQSDCGKLQTLSTLLKRLKENGHRVIIFTQMTKMLDVLEPFLSLHSYPYLRLDGGMNPKDRLQTVELFNSNPKYFVFISTTRAGGVGINLTGADTVVFYDSDWNPQMDAQAQDRAHRIGQTKKVSIYRLVSQATVEENILTRASQKRVLKELVVDSGRKTSLEGLRGRGLPKFARLEIDKNHQRRELEGTGLVLDKVLPSEMEAPIDEEGDDVLLQAEDVEDRLATEQVLMDDNAEIVVEGDDQPVETTMITEIRGKLDAFTRDLGMMNSLSSAAWKRAETMHEMNAVPMAAIAQDKPQDDLDQWTREQAEKVQEMTALESFDADDVLFYTLPATTDLNDRIRAAVKEIRASMHFFVDPKPLPTKSKTPGGRGGRKPAPADKRPHLDDDTKATRPIRRPKPVPKPEKPSNKQPKRPILDQVIAPEPQAAGQPHGVTFSIRADMSSGEVFNIVLPSSHGEMNIDPPVHMVVRVGARAVRLRMGDLMGRLQHDAYATRGGDQTLPFKLSDKRTHHATYTPSSAHFTELEALFLLRAVAVLSSEGVVGPSWGTQSMASLIHSLTSVCTLHNRTHPALAVRGAYAFLTHSDQPEVDKSRSPLEPLSRKLGKLRQMVADIEDRIFSHLLINMLMPVSLVVEEKTRAITGQRRAEVVNHIMHLDRVHMQRVIQDQVTPAAPVDQTATRHLEMMHTRVTKNVSLVNEIDAQLGTMVDTELRPRLSMRPPDRSGRLPSNGMDGVLADIQELSRSPPAETVESVLGLGVPGAIESLRQDQLLQLSQRYMSITAPPAAVLPTLVTTHTRSEKEGDCHRPYASDRTGVNTAIQTPWAI